MDETEDTEGPALNPETVARLVAANEFANAEAAKAYETLKNIDGAEHIAQNVHATCLQALVWNAGR